MTKDAAAQEIARLLTQRSDKVVFAESCTAGMVAATLASVPGISQYLCGSLVTYRPEMKRRWLGVKKKTIRKYTTESKACAAEMALCALQRTPEATWGVSVVGHLGPDAPPEKDGLIHVCIARRTAKGNLKVKDETEYTCQKGERVRRQEEATEVVLTTFSRLLNKKSQNETSVNGNGTDHKRRKKGKKAKREKTPA